LRNIAQGTVFALCFREGDETHHRWRVFVHGSSGVCIRFDRASLLKGLTKSKFLLDRRKLGGPKQKVLARGESGYAQLTRLSPYAFL
jgi:hypothetical protein